VNLDRALAFAGALEVIDVWCRAPNTVHAEPGRGFATAFADAMRSGSAPGNLANDAFLAALAAEHGAAVAILDRDFARFPELEIVVPGGRREVR